jgi:HTH-type transcriptional regulator, competence development regulator
VPENQEQKHFGDIVRELRLKRNISLRKFAEMMKISPTYLSKIERNEIPAPAEDVVRRMAEALHQDPDSFLAEANRISSDLEPIIKARPKVLAALLRSTKNWSSAEIEEFTKAARQRRKPDEPEESK